MRLAKNQSKLTNFYYYRSARCRGWFLDNFGRALEVCRRGLPESQKSNDTHNNNRVADYVFRGGDVDAIYAHLCSQGGVNSDNRVLRGVYVELSKISLTEHVGGVPSANGNSENEVVSITNVLKLPWNAINPPVAELVSKQSTSPPIIPPGFIPKDRQDDAAFELDRRKTIVTTILKVSDELETN